jgi:hypothetical protein
MLCNDERFLLAACLGFFEWSDEDGKAAGCLADREGKGTGI